MIKGPSFFDIIDAFKSKTKFQYFCPECGHGPFYTGHANTNCPACTADIKLTSIEGDIVVEATKNKKRQ